MLTARETSPRKLSGDLESWAFVGAGHVGTSARHTPTSQTPEGGQALSTNRFVKGSGSVSCARQWWGQGPSRSRAPTARPAPSASAPPVPAQLASVKVAPPANRDSVRVLCPSDADFLSLPDRSGWALGHSAGNRWHESLHPGVGFALTTERRLLGVARPVISSPSRELWGSLGPGRDTRAAQPAHGGQEWPGHLCA